MWFFLLFLNLIVFQNLKINPIIICKSLVVLTEVETLLGYRTRKLNYIAAFNLLRTRNSELSSTEIQLLLEEDYNQQY